MTTVVLIEGTWGGTWAQDRAPFRQLLAREGFEVSLPPFEWSGDVSGIPSLTSNGKHSDWRAGGASLWYYLKSIPFEQRNLIAHSYGGNVVAYCAGAHQMPIRRLITVGTPPRSDMDPLWVLAKRSIGYWLHVCDTRSAFIERIAQAFDGNWDWKAKVGQRLADQTAKYPGIGHSGILSDPRYLPLWTEQQLLTHLSLPDEVIGGRRVAVIG